jgi:hypothetical protein
VSSWGKKGGNGVEKVSFDANHGSLANIIDSRRNHKMRAIGKWLKMGHRCAFAGADRFS